MESPDWRDVDHEVLIASSKDAAVELWAKRNKSLKDLSLLKKEENGNWSYWGWMISVNQLVVE